MGTPASPATARASSVLPVPGGPSMMAPRGILAPRAEYLAGFLRKSTTSVSSCLEPSQPATSSKVTPVFGSIWICERDLPTCIWPIGPPPPPPGPPGPPRDARMLSPMRRSSGAKLRRTPPTVPRTEATAPGDCERNVALAQLLDELGVASREELHRVVLAFLIKGDRTLAILREDDLGNLIRTGLVEQCAICPRLGSERRPTSSQGCCECSGHRRRLPITLGTHDKRGAAGARGDVVGDGGIQRVRTGGGRQGKHPRESGVGRGGCALGEGCPRLEK